MRVTTAASAVVLGCVAAAALFAPRIAPHSDREQLRDHLYAPPTRVRVIAEDGWRRPFIYPLRLVNRLERIYEEDRSRPVALVWLGRSRLVETTDASAPLLVLGTDSVGRDLFARLVHGARLSLGVAAAGLCGTLILGVALGGMAGYAGGWLDALIMRLAEFVIVLPVIYVVLALRAALPLVLPVGVLFGITASIFALVGWPHIARGVRTIVAAERERDYASAARAVGCGRGRILTHHLLPAAFGFVGTQALLLFPAFVLAEATLSYAGLGFAEPAASWGTLLRDAGHVHVMAEFPWLLSPAAAIVAVVLALNGMARSCRISP